MIIYYFLKISSKILFNSKNYCTFQNNIIFLQNNPERKLRTKEGNKEADIFKAAIEVFAEQGYHKAKIWEVAERAGVATGSVYVYFENKEDLLNKIFEKLWAEILSQLTSIKSDVNISPLEKLNSIVDNVFSVFSENPSLAIVFVNEHNTVTLSEDHKFKKFYDNFLDIGEEIIKEGTRAGIFSEKVDLKVFRPFIFGAIRNSLHEWAQKPEELPILHICDQIKLFLINGIAAK